MVKTSTLEEWHFKTKHFQQATWTEYIHKLFQTCLGPTLTPEMCTITVPYPWLVSFIKGPFTNIGMVKEKQLTLPNKSFGDILITLFVREWIKATRKVAPSSQLHDRFLLLSLIRGYGTSMERDWWGTQCTRYWWRATFVSKQPIQSHGRAHRSSPLLPSMDAINNNTNNNLY